MPEYLVKVVVPISHFLLQRDSIEGEEPQDIRTSLLNSQFKIQYSKFTGSRAGKVDRIPLVD